MLDKFKKIDLREDGFLEVTLKRVKDFDDYIFQQIQKDGNCLACVRDHRSKSKFYYDTKGYLTLKDYLHSHMFERGELLSFLIYVLEYLVKTNTSKPVSMQLDHIFISYDGGSIRFLVFPVTLDNWLFQQEESKVFLTSFIQLVKVVDGYEAIGYLAYAMKHEEISLPSILQGLHDIKEQIKRKPSFIEKLLHLDNEEEYYIRDIPQRVSYPNMNEYSQINEAPTVFETESDNSIKKIHQNTVALFKDEEDVYLDDVITKEKIVISQDIFTIGRTSDNSLVIPHSYISSYHAVIKDKKILEDLHSSNGTSLNQEPITECELHDGDTINFADKEYVFRNPDE